MLSWTLHCNVLPQCPKLIDLVSVDPRMIIFLPLPDLSPLPVTINSYMHVSNPCYTCILVIHACIQSLLYLHIVDLPTWCPLTWPEDPTSVHYRPIIEPAACLTVKPSPSIKRGLRVCLCVKLNKSAHAHISVPVHVSPRVCLLDKQCLWHHCIY